MRNPLLRIFIPVLLILTLGCREDYPFPGEPGKKPVYIPLEELGDIRNLDPQPTQNTGTIYLIGDLFFMVERNKGIHVIDISNPSVPQKLTFIKIPAVNDFTISGTILYADNGPNLVSLDISDLMNIVVLHVEKNAFKPILYPPLYNGYFECVDPEKGAVIDWEDTYIYGARCRTLN